MVPNMQANATQFNLAYESQCRPFRVYYETLVASYPLTHHELENEERKLENSHNYLL